MLAFALIVGIVLGSIGTFAYLYITTPYIPPPVLPSQLQEYHIWKFTDGRECVVFYELPPLPGETQRQVIVGIGEATLEFMQAQGLPTATYRAGFANNTLYYRARQQQQQLRFTSGDTSYLLDITGDAMACFLKVDIYPWVGIVLGRMAAYKAERDPLPNWSKKGTMIDGTTTCWKTAPSILCQRLSV